MLEGIVRTRIRAHQETYLFGIHESVYIYVICMDRDFKIERVLLGNSIDIFLQSIPDAPLITNNRSFCSDSLSFCFYFVTTVREYPTRFEAIEAF